MPAAIAIPMFTADAQYLPPAAGEKPKTNGGRWRLNAGSVMAMAVEGLNEDKPIRCVINLATVSIPTGRIPALRDHDETRPLGFWSGFVASDSGLDADLTLLDPADGAEADVLPDAVEARALIRAGFPLQASVGGGPAAGDGWKRIAAGETVRMNGRDYEAPEDDDTPLYAIEGMQLKESSLCLWGADRRTGPIAAKATSTKDQPMPAADLKAMKTKYAGKPAEIRAMVADLVADEKTEAEIGEAVHAAEIKAMQASITAKDAEITTLKTGKGAENKGKDDDSKESDQPPGFEASDKAAAPKSWGEARVLLAREHKDLKGQALNDEVKRRFPSLKASDSSFAASNQSTSAGR